MRARARPHPPTPRKCDAVIVVAALFALASCVRATGGEAKNASAPSVAFPSGRAYRVEVAATPAARAQGLMFRESLSPGRGMLFLFPAPSVESFWMKNCNFPIDIVWMDANRKVLFVSAHTPPCSEDPCPTYGPKVQSLFVLEIPDGAAAKEKIVPGALLKFENVPGSPKE